VYFTAFLSKDVDVDSTIVFDEVGYNFGDGYNSTYGRFFAPVSGD
jgi:hypothetical protein